MHGDEMCESRDLTCAPFESFGNQGCPHNSFKCRLSIPPCWAILYPTNKICKANSNSGQIVLGWFKSPGLCMEHCFENDYSCHYIQFIKYPNKVRGRCKAFSVC